MKRENESKATSNGFKALLIGLGILWISILIKMLNDGVQYW
jgi:hypothetical protein